MTTGRINQVTRLFTNALDSDTPLCAKHKTGCHHQEQLCELSTSRHESIGTWTDKQPTQFPNRPLLIEFPMKLEKRVSHSESEDHNDSITHQGRECWAFEAHVSMLGQLPRCKFAIRQLLHTKEQSLRGI